MTGFLASLCSHCLGTISDMSSEGKKQSKSGSPGASSAGYAIAVDVTKAEVYREMMCHLCEKLSWARVEAGVMLSNFFFLVCCATLRTEFQQAGKVIARRGGEPMGTSDLVALATMHVEWQDHMLLGELVDELIALGRQEERAFWDHLNSHADQFYDLSTDERLMDNIFRFISALLIPTRIDISRQYSWPLRSTLLSDPAMESNHKASSKADDQAAQSAQGSHTDPKFSPPDPRWDYAESTSRLGVPLTFPSHPHSYPKNGEAVPVEQRDDTHPPHFDPMRAFISAEDPLSTVFGVRTNALTGDGSKPHELQWSKKASSEPLPQSDEPSTSPEHRATNFRVSSLPFSQEGQSKSQDWAPRHRSSQPHLHHPHFYDETRNYSQTPEAGMPALHDQLLPCQTGRGPKPHVRFEALQASRRRSTPPTTHTHFHEAAYDSGPRLSAMPPARSSEANKFNPFLDVRYDQT